MARVRKEIRELVKRAAEQGWRVEERRGGAILLFSPDEELAPRCDSRLATRRVRPASMIEWLISIGTPNGVTRDEDTLIRFRESFETVLGETGVAASMNTEHGSLSATFSIAAPTAEKATEEGFVVFRKAVELTGLAPCDPARVEVEQIPADEAVPA